MITSDPPPPVEIEVQWESVAAEEGKRKVPGDPMIPSLHDDRFERGELLVSHKQSAQDILFKQGRARQSISVDVNHYVPV